MKLIHSKLAAVLALTISAALPAAAATFAFTTTLSNVGEPVPTSTATGSATVTFDDIAKTVAVSLSYSGLAATPSAAHMHCCTELAGSGSIGVKLNFSGLPVGNTNTYNNNNTAFTPTLTVFNELFAGTQAGKAYVNVHTAGTYSAGEIRGFLSPVPEASTYAMMLAGLVGVGAVARRRRLQG